MNRRTKLKTHALAFCLLATLAASATPQRSAAQTSPPKPAATPQTAPAAAPQPSTPTEVVRAYYTALKESRVRDAMLMSILRPAVEPLSAEELKEFETDFARLAATAPADFEITGEQLSGDEATVFVRTGDEKDVKVEPVNLIRGPGGGWIVGDRENAALVKKQGKKFFFEQRIAAHEADVKDIFTRISLGQLLYSRDHNGAFADLNTLVRAGLVPQDILGAETTGYRFTVTADGKAWAARAEPARYGRTGRLSFYMDAAGVQSKDTGGKPLSPPKSK